MTNSFFVCFHFAAKPTKAQGKEIQNINTISVMYLYLRNIPSRNRKVLF